MDNNYYCWFCDTLKDILKKEGIKGFYGNNTTTVYCIFCGKLLGKEADDGQDANVTESVHPINPS